MNFFDKTYTLACNNDLSILHLEIQQDLKLKSVTFNFKIWNIKKISKVPYHNSVIRLYYQNMKVFLWKIVAIFHDDVIKWKHFPHYWPFVRGIHRSPVNSPHKGQWRGTLMFTLICVWINGCVNNRKAGDLWRDCIHYGVTVMFQALVCYCL